MIIGDLIKGYKLHILTTSNPGYDDPPPPFLEGHSCKILWVSLGRTRPLFLGIFLFYLPNQIKFEEFLAKGQKSATWTLFWPLKTLFPLLKNIPPFFIWFASDIPNSHWCLIDWAKKIKASPRNKNSGLPKLKKTWTLSLAKKMKIKVDLHQTINFFYETLYEYNAYKRY